MLIKPDEVNNKINCILFLWDCMKPTRIDIHFYSSVYFVSSKTFYIFAVKIYYSLLTIYDFDNGWDLYKPTGIKYNVIKYMLGT